MEKLPPSGADRNRIIFGILASFVRLCAVFTGALIIWFLTGLLVTRNQRSDEFFNIVDAITGEISV